MKSPEKNRFARSGVRSSSDVSGALALDVEGRVDYELGVARRVLVFGRSFSFDADGATVRIEGCAYRLALVRDRVCLLPD